MATTDEPPSVVDRAAVLDTAWRTHDALRDWTGKVDAKASFALTIESAVLGATVALSGRSGRLGGLHGQGLLAYRVGLLLLAVAALAAVSAVIPQVRRSSTKTESRDSFIFFGHLRHWNADELAGAWASRDPTPVLARQAVVMSKIAWGKHRRLQLSLTAAVLGTASLVLGAGLR